MNNYEKPTNEFRQVRFHYRYQSDFVYYKIQQKFLVQIAPTYKGFKVNENDMMADWCQSWFAGGNGRTIPTDSVEWIPVKETWRFLPEINEKDLEK